MDFIGSLTRAITFSLHRIIKLETIYLYWTFCWSRIFFARLSAALSTLPILHCPPAPHCASHVDELDVRHPDNIWHVRRQICVCVCRHQ